MRNKRMLVEFRTDSALTFCVDFSSSCLEEKRGELFLEIVSQMAGKRFRWKGKFDFSPVCSKHVNSVDIAVAGQSPLERSKVRRSYFTY